jgi:Immunity protein 35
MLTEADARQKITDLLPEWGRSVKGGLVVMDEMTLTKPYGWVFFYNSRRYLETRDILHAIAGNGPVVVLADTGEVVTLGTARRWEEAIAAFEQQRRLPR